MADPVAKIEPDYRGLDEAGARPLRLFSTWEITRYLIPGAPGHFRRVLKAKKISTAIKSDNTAPTNGIANRRLRLKLNPFEVKRSIASKGMRKNEKGQVKARRQLKAVRLQKAKKG